MSWIHVSEFLIILLFNHRIVYHRGNLKQLLIFLLLIELSEIINPTKLGALEIMTKKDEPNLIIDFCNEHRMFEKQGIHLTKIVEKISGEFGNIIGMSPPFPFLVKNHEIFNIPFFSRLYYQSENQQSYYQNSIEFFKSLGIDGLIINDYSIPMYELERNIRDSRTHRLFTLVYSPNEAVSAALSKFDPNAIVFAYPENTPNETPLSKIPPELIENHVKRISIENPKVSVFSGVGIHGRVDIEKGLELQVDGFVLEIPYASLKDPYEYLVKIASPLRNN